MPKRKVVVPGHREKVTRYNVFAQAAIQRHREAHILLEGGGYIGAIYLGGYVIEKIPLLFFLIKLFLLGKEKVWIECYLKYLICERYNVIHMDDWENEVEQKTGIRPQVTSARGHFLEVLLDYAGLEGSLRRNAKVYAAFQIVNQWHVGLRYYPSTTSRRNAERFLEAVELIRRWLLARTFKWKGRR